MKRSFRWILMAKRGWTDVEIGGVHSYEDAKGILRWYRLAYGARMVWIEDAVGATRWILDEGGEQEGFP